MLKPIAMRRFHVLAVALLLGCGCSGPQDSAPEKQNDQAAQPEPQSADQQADDQADGSPSSQNLPLPIGQGDRDDLIIFDPPPSPQVPGGAQMGDDEDQEQQEQTPANQTVTRNLSNFQEFRCVQRPAPEPCLDPGSVYEAVITRTFADEYVLNLSIIEPGIVGQDVCINVPSTSVCLTAVPRQQRILTQDEAGDVRSAFDAVEIREDSTTDCSEQTPCGTVDFSWDDYQVSDFCEGPRLQAQQASEVLQLIAQLSDAYSDDSETDSESDPDPPAQGVGS